VQTQQPLVTARPCSAGHLPAARTIAQQPNGIQTYVKQYCGGLRAELARGLAGRPSSVNLAGDSHLPVPCVLDTESKPTMMLNIVSNNNMRLYERRKSDHHACYICWSPVLILSVAP
jgi:hypothetical protein